MKLTVEHFEVELDKIKNQANRTIAQRKLKKHLRAYNSTTCDEEKGEIYEAMGRALKLYQPGHYAYDRSKYDCSKWKSSQKVYDLSKWKSSQTVYGPYDRSKWKSLQPDYDRSNWKSSQPDNYKRLCNAKVLADLQFWEDAENFDDVCDFDFHVWNVNGGGEDFFVLAFENPLRVPRGIYGGNCIRNAIERLSELFPGKGFRVIIADISPIRSQDGVSLLKFPAAKFDSISTAHTQKGIALIKHKNCIGVVHGVGQIPPSKSGFNLHIPNQNQVRIRFLELVYDIIEASMEKYDSVNGNFHQFYWGVSKQSGYCYGDLFLHMSALANSGAPLKRASAALMKKVKLATLYAVNVERKRLFKKK